MARATDLFNLKHNSVCITIYQYIVNYLLMTGTLSLLPELLPASAPVISPFCLDGLFERFLIHKRYHEHLTCLVILGYGCYQTILKFQVFYVHNGIQIIYKLNNLSKGFYSLTAASIHSSVVAIMLLTPQRLGTYLCAFPEFTIMHVNLSLAGETTMQVSQKTFAPLFSMRFMSSGYFFFMAREVQIQTSFLTLFPSRSRANLSSSSTLQ